MSQAGAQTVVRPARATDLAAITEIYNHYVSNSIATFDLETFSVESRSEWFAAHTQAPYQTLVAEAQGNVVGYCSAGKFRPKPAYAASVETSVYVRPERAGQGLGRALYVDLFTNLEREDLHRAYAIIATPNPTSVVLHERFGFRRVGLLQEVGFKFERFIDIEIYEKKLANEQ